MTEAHNIIAKTLTQIKIKTQNIKNVKLLSYKIKVISYKITRYLTSK